MNFFLGSGAIKAIHDAIDALFNRAKVKFLGKSYGPKRLVISATTEPVGYRHDLSLPGIFESSCRIEGMVPRDILKEHIVQTAEAYLDATQAKAKAQVVNAVKSFITDAEHKGVEVDPQVVLGGELSEVMRKVTSDVKRIVGTETTRARNLGTVDSISKVNTLIGVSDPTVCFIPVKDQFLCLEENEEVLLPGNKTKKVGDLKVGDALALPTRPEQRTANRVKALVKKEAEVVRLSFDNGKELICTKEHPVLVRCNGILVFVEAKDLEDRHEVVFIEDLDSKGKRQEAAHAINPKPFMVRMGYESSFAFWKNEKDEMLRLIKETGDRGGVFSKYSLKLHEWDGYVRPILEVYFPGQIELVGGVPGNFFNKEYVEAKSRAVRAKVGVYAVRYEGKGGDVWFSKMIESGADISGLTEELVGEDKEGWFFFRDFLRAKVKTLGLAGVIKGRGGKRNWEKNRELLIKKAKKRGCPHFGAVSKPEQRFVDKLRSLGVRVVQTYPISNMKVDLFLEDCGVVVEYDGSGHNMRDRIRKGARKVTAQIDFSRDKLLKGMGYRVLRVKAPKDSCPEDFSFLFDFIKSERTFDTWRV
jgi:Protein of unknown function (DUF559).